MSDTTQIAAAIADKLTDAFHAYATPAWELSLAATQADATITVYTGVACFVAMLVTAGLTTLFALIALKAERQATSRNDNIAGVYTFMSVMCGFISLILLICSLANILDLWAWYGMNHPEVYLAHNLLSKAL